MFAGFRTRIRFLAAYFPSRLDHKTLSNQRFDLSQTLTRTEMGTQTLTKRRPVCPSCSKPTRLCLCARIKIPSLDNSIAVTILLHSQERKHPLNSTRIATLGLKNISVVTVSDVHSEARFLIRLLDSKLKNQNEEISDFDQTKSEEPIITATISKCGYTCSLTRLQTPQNHISKPDFDHLSSTQVGQEAIANGFVVKKLQKKQLNGINELEESEEFEIAVPPGSALLFPTKKSIGIEAVDFEVKHLIVLDGTWGKAKRMYHENPWLKLLPHLKLDPKNMSLYSEVRHQPKVGCLSTIESIVSALKAFGDNREGLDQLLDVFESMIVDQRRCKDERLSKISLSLSLSE